MSLRQVKETIGEYRFTVSVLPAVKSRRLLIKLLKSFGPALSPAAAGAGVDASTLVKGICEHLDADLLDEVCETFASVTMVEGTKSSCYLTDTSSFNAIFSGNMGLMFRWLKLCLLNEYSDFLADLRGLTTDDGQPPQAEIMESRYPHT